MLESRASKIFVFMSLLVFQLALVFIDETVYTERILSVVLTGVTILLIIRSVLKQNTVLVIVFLFMGTYVFILNAFYFFGIYFSFFTQCYEDGLVYFAAQLVLLFYSFLYYFLSIGDLQSGIKMKPNLIGYLSTLGFLLAIVFSQVSGASILDSGSYSGVTSTRSFVPIEYALMFIPLAYIYSSNRFQRAILYLGTILFCGKYMLYGGRVALVEVFMVLLILKFQFLWTMKKALAVTMVLGGLLLFYGVIRANLSGAVFTIDQMDLNSANAGEVYYSSIRVLYLIKYDILTVGDRIMSFAIYLISGFYAGLSLPPLSNLSVYLKAQYPSGGGGLAPIYFYTYLSFPGVMFLGYFVGKVFSNLTRIKEINFKSIYVIMVVTMVPRWFAYYPVHLVKLCIYAAIAFFLLNNVSKSVLQLSVKEK